jgi:acyl-CoA thioester hydrolase
MLKHTTEVRIRYSETDQMHFVYNGKYFDFFEVGRAEMMRDLNLTYKEIEARGYGMPVVETFIKFKNPAYYDEVLSIETRVEKLPELKVHIDHTITCPERNKTIVEGYVDLVFLNSETKKLSRPPDFFINAIKKYFK